MNETPTTGPNIPKPSKLSRNWWLVLVNAVMGFKKAMFVAFKILLLVVGCAALYFPIFLMDKGNMGNAIQAAIFCWGAPSLVLCQKFYSVVTKVWWPEIKRRAGVE